MASPSQDIVFRPYLKHWEGYTFPYHGKHLYKDLAKHFTKLHEDLIKFEDYIRKTMPEYLEKIAKIVNDVDGFLEREVFEPILKQLGTLPELLTQPQHQHLDLVKKVLAEYSPQIKPVYCSIIINMIFGVPESHWPNMKSTVENNKDVTLVKLRTLAEEYVKKNERLVSDAKKLREEIMNIAKEVSEQIEQVLHLQKLPGKCNFI